jgi:hypothetical protein
VLRSVRGDKLPYSSSYPPPLYSLGIGLPTLIFSILVSFGRYNQIALCLSAFSLSSSGLFISSYLIYQHVSARPADIPPLLYRSSDSAINNDLSESEIALGSPVQLYSNMWGRGNGILPSQGEGEGESDAAPYPIRWTTWKLAAQTLFSPSEMIDESSRETRVTAVGL